MSARRLALPLALAALLCMAPAACARPADLASEAALLRGAAQLDRDLAVLGPGSSPLGTPGGTLAELRFRNADGYTIVVAAFGQTVAIGVSRGTHAPSSTYLAHGSVRPGSISASFGERGRVAIRFRPKRSLLHGGRGAPCPGVGAIARLGVFVGTVRFRGEGGYTAAEVHRARGGAIDISAFIACLRNAARAPRGLFTTMPAAPGVPTHPSRGPRPTTLVADDKQPLSRTLFAAQSRGRHARFLAAEERTDGSVGIVRFATARASSASLVADDALSLAGVTPPAPFSGSATLQRGAAGAKSWSGSLAVDFPGARVPLTGPGFAVQLARGF